MGAPRQEKAAACQMSFPTPPEILQRVEESICLLSLEKFSSQEGLVGPVLLNISMLLLPAEGLAALLSSLVV